MAFKEVAKQSSKYFIGEILVMFSSLISFPILTRILPQNEYGIMSLIAVTCGIFGPISALGTHFSMLRFYHNYKNNNALKDFFKKMLTVILVSGFFAVCILMFFVIFFKTERFLSIEYRSTLLIALILMVTQNVFWLLHSSYRLEEKVFLYNFLNVLRRYAALIVSILLVLVFKNLFTFYLGQLIVHLVLISLLIAVVFKGFSYSNHKIEFKAFLPQTFKYGFPLAITGIVTFFFSAGDRYIIAYFLGAKSVAVYSVAGNLGGYLKESLITAINLSLMPIAFKLWEEQRIEQVRKIFTSMVRYYYLLAAAIVALFFLVSQELLVIIASEKYAQSASVAPLLMCGIMASSFIFPFSAGLHFEKKTLKIFLLTIVFTLINVILNIIWIPEHGIKGAAFATMVSSFFFIFSNQLFSHKYFSFKIPFSAVLKYTVICFGAYFITNQVWISSGLKAKIFLSLCFKVLFFLGFYILLIMIFDQEIRKKVWGWRSKLSIKAMILNEKKD
ncbi:MAG: oligosaccharide flippase family protein [Candidatus Omnitrophota bacterium]